jgi:hypothetical protein
MASFKRMDFEIRNFIEICMGVCPNKDMARKVFSMKYPQYLKVFDNTVS